MEPLPKTTKWRKGNHHCDFPQTHNGNITEDSSPCSVLEMDIDLSSSLQCEHEEDTVSCSDTISEVLPDSGNTEGVHEFPNSESEFMGAPLYPGSDITLAQCVVLILAYSLRHNLSARAVEDNLKLLSLLLPANNILPHSLHIFKTLFKNPADSITIHYFCEGCGMCLPKQNTHCMACGDKSDNDKNLREGNFFISVSLDSQIRDILQREDCPIVEHTDVHHSEMLKGITNFSCGDVSLLWNCDGISVFNSSSYSLWPIRCVINELPAEVRYKNVLLAGVWFGRGKPEMSTFFKQFVEDIKEINTHGVKWVHPKTGITRVSRVFPVACTCDAVARCMLQGVHQFNGAYGCGFCLSEGMVVAKGRGYTRVYPAVQAEMRSHEHVVECGQKAIEEGVDHILGVKSLSPLILLSSSTGFDIVKSFPVDYMHCVLLGVTKQYLDLWFNSKYHDCPWYSVSQK
ncbi:uncharacterized protein LOC134320859 [Trichomycterus rosablanca]|uniref:uncharacterized protein LOC134320859 n=1 Tax=Trichomycterus rosablanca TaxID=2290929 RepID=UPI002F35F31C